MQKSKQILLSAALGGLFSASVLANETPKKETTPTKETTTKETTTPAGTTAKASTGKGDMVECKGVNACAGKGEGGKNACHGKGVLKLSKSECEKLTAESQAKTKG